MKIVFTDPPNPERRGGHSKHPWQQIADQLRERPGEWALCLRDMYDSSASGIRLGRNAAFPKGHFDARAVRPTDRNLDVPRGQEGRKKAIFDLYIRYIPEEERTESQ